MTAQRNYQTHSGKVILRQGTPEHDAGLCLLLIASLSDDCTPQGKRRRSELAQSRAAGTIWHESAIAFAG